jgi:hypothetical protein
MRQDPTLVGRTIRFGFDKKIRRLPAPSRFVEVPFIDPIFTHALTRALELCGDTLIERASVDWHAVQAAKGSAGGDVMRTLTTRVQAVQSRSSTEKQIFALIVSRERNRARHRCFAEEPSQPRRFRARSPVATPHVFRNTASAAVVTLKTDASDFPMWTGSKCDPATNV